MPRIPRKNRKTEPKFETAKSEDSSTLFAFRIAELEKRVAELEQQFHSMNHFDLPTAPKPKRGPKPRLRESELLRRRDSLIYWLEDNWPELSRAIRKAKNGEQLIPALRRMRPLSTQYEQPPFCCDWKQHWPLLWEFVSKSKRYFNNPRNIANALAGIPELSWKRSFDVCSNHPSHLEIQARAVLDYLRRNVPERLKAIRAVNGDVEQIQQILQTRTKDIQLIILSQRAMNVAQYLSEGERGFRRNIEHP
jgi:hypothetical protein